MNMEAHPHGFGTSTDDPSENYDIVPPSSSNHDFSYYQHDFSTQLPHDDDIMSMMSSSRLFPCHGLSLSLNSSAIGLQPFELRPQTDDHYIRLQPSGYRSVVDNTHYHGGLIRGSRYMVPAQELLSEFCDIRTGQRGDGDKMKGVEKVSDSWQGQPLHSLDLPHLQRRKIKLLQMLEEVDRRYKHYCDRMKSVVYSFESVAGDGAATAYSGMASRAMSRHFRCLRDGISSQIKATRQAMGEKAGCAPGTTICKVETLPRLRVLDQTLRQQRAMQQMGSMDSTTHPWRPQRGLPERSVSALRAWLFEHFLHPYPSDVDKHILARQTGLSRSQVSNWFINARVRLWKPMVEEMYMEELKEEGPDQNQDDPSHNSDHKSTHCGQVVIRNESECLSSIINSSNNPDRRNKGSSRNKGQNPAIGEIGDHSFAAAMEYDFSSYGYGDGVSLTLGLHHHHGMNLPFSPTEGQEPMFYHPRDVDDDHDVPACRIDGEKARGRNRTGRFVGI